MNKHYCLFTLIINHSGDIMLTYQDFNMPDKIGKCLNMSVEDIIESINKTCDKQAHYRTQVRIDESSKIPVSINIVDSLTLKIIIVDHDFILHNTMSPIRYLDNLHQSFTIKELEIIARPLANALYSLNK